MPPRLDGGWYHWSCQVACTAPWLPLSPSPCMTVPPDHQARPVSETSLRKSKVSNLQILKMLLESRLTAWTSQVRETEQIKAYDKTIATNASIRKELEPEACTCRRHSHPQQVSPLPPRQLKTPPTQFWIVDSSYLKKIIVVRGKEAASTALHWSKWQSSNPQVCRSDNL